MFCKNCGNQISDGAKFCNSCGAQQESPQGQQNYQQNYQQHSQQSSWEQQQEYQRQQNWQQYQREHPNYQQQQQQQQYYYQPPINQQGAMPMKWFKFIIYFQLFFNMLVNIGNAITALTGSQYGDAKELVYVLYPKLKTVDIIYAVLCVLLVVIAVVARQKLASFKKDGPLTYLICQGANLAVSVIYLILVAVIGNVDLRELDVSTVIGSIGMSVIMICVNGVYFNKRKHLFIN